MQKRGQELIEAVIYILIALVIMGLLMAVAYPKIEKMKDKSIIDQSIDMLEKIDSTILEMRRGGPGNQRVIELGIKQGFLKIDGVGDKLIFEMESTYTYSEPGLDYIQGNIMIHTTKTSDTNTVTLTLRNNGEYNLTYQNEDATKDLTKASLPYSLLLSNEGEGPNEKVIIDITLK
jgi:type II secretory pathway pseudopilin PulG